MSWTPPWDLKYQRKILQHTGEFDRFIDLMRGENIRSYLEIGCKFGGTLWRIGSTFPAGTRIVAVDLPHGDTSFKESQEHLEHCCDHLGHLGYDCHLFLGDSTEPRIIEAVRSLGPFDLCFIDANHTEPYVRKDWAHYGPMARIVAFHDIGWISRGEYSKKMPIEVPRVWNEIKLDYKHHEIRMCERDNGIGILWRRNS